MMDDGWTIERIRPIILDSIDLFGLERCMFASYFPVDGLYADYGALLRPSTRSWPGSVRVSDRHCSPAMQTASN